jgi:F-type H+-transporting ATPase subunit gamma
LQNLFRNSLRVTPTRDAPAAYTGHPGGIEVKALPAGQQLLPLDEAWRGRLAELPWPTGNLPEVMGEGTASLRALIREYLFVSLYRACAESLASENASRLAAMQRAEKNIDDLLEDLNGRFHRLRQSGIDEELFDVISGFEALTGARQRQAKPGIAEESK